MDGETILQVKISRKDVYDAVRNLLLNEFKVMPHDLEKAVDQKIDNKLRHVIEELIYKRYGFDAKVERHFAEVIKEAKTTVSKTVVDQVREALKEAGVEDLVKKVMAKILLSVKD